MGAPLGGKYTADEKLAICRTICEHIATSTRSIASICEDPEIGIPVIPRTFWVWMEQDDFEPEEMRLGLSDMYYRAKEFQSEVAIDETVDIADDARNDWMEREARNGDTYLVPDKENIARSKLRVETRQWQAIRLRPKRFGNRQEVEHSGTVGVGLVEKLDEARALTEAKRQERLAKLREKRDG